MKYPIIILSKERPRQFLEMVQSIERRTDPDTYRLIVCDNASTHPEMIKALHKVAEKHIVIFNRDNRGFEGFNPGLEMVDTDYFFLSDPDIILNKNMPCHWVLRMVEALAQYPVPKIGVALDINFQEITPFTAKIREIELQYWSGEVALPGIRASAYPAPVDTTLAVYRKDTYRFWQGRPLRFMPGENEGIADCKQIHQNQYNDDYYMPVVRIAGEYTCVHTGWLPHKYQDEMEYYADHCDFDLASSVKGWKAS